MDIRSKRLEELIKEKLSALLLKGLKDPRLETFITILGVDLSKDGRTAKVFISVIGTEKEKKAAIKALNHARGYIQMRIGINILKKCSQILKYYRIQHLLQ